MIKKLFLLIILFMAMGSTITAKNYFVKADGDDSKDGLTDATAWQTLGKVNSFIFEKGDDVYFKCGSVWKLKYLSINWSGSEDNYTNIGAYYGDGVIGVSGEKPTIDGEYKDIDYPYTGLVVVSGNYITVSNLNILGSVSRGISVENKKYINVNNCYINKTLIQGILFSGVENGNIEDNELEDCGRHREDTESNVYTPCIAVNHRCKNINIRRNIVHDTHGEAINSFSRNDGILIEHNICYNFRSVGIYMDNSRNTIVRYNLVYNTDDKTYWRTSTGPGMGIWNTVEPFGGEVYNDNLEIYGNLVAWCKIGICINSDGLTNVPAKNVKYYNNTIIDCEVNLEGWNLDFEDCEIKNNIFYKLSSNCEQVGWSTKPGGLTISNNLWSSSVPASILGTGSIVADPKLFKNSDWRDLHAGNVQANLFALFPESPAIDAGAVLDTEYAKILDQATIFTQYVRTKDQRDFGSGWEMGGIIYSGKSDQATAPFPENDAIKTENYITLSWVPGGSSISHNLYFGKADSLEFITNQTDTLYSLTNLDYFQVYNWRVDEVTATDTIRGQLWNYKTAYEELPPELAFNPKPNHAQEEVQINSKPKWQAGYRTISNDVYFGTTNPPPFKVNQNDTIFNPGTLELNTTYYWRIDGINEHGTIEGSIWSFKTIENPILPEGWYSSDIGDVGLSGSSKEGEKGVFTVASSGNNLVGEEDAFHFTYKSLFGDSEIVAKIVSLDNTDPLAAAGLMIREDLSAGSKFASISISSENGDVFQIRKKTNDFSEQSLNNNVVAPYWLKLKKVSTKYIIGQISSDGKAWKTVKTEQLSIDNISKIGLFVTSANNSVLATAIIDSVSIDGEIIAALENNRLRSIVPEEFSISNYPNPFNPSTKIRYTLPENGLVSIEIYDILGSKVRELIYENKNAGVYTEEWDATDNLNSKVTSGVYFYRVIFGKKIKTGKMLLMR